LKYNLLALWVHIRLKTIFRSISIKALLHLEKKNRKKKSLDIKYDLRVLIVDLTDLYVYIIDSFAFCSVQADRKELLINKP